MRATVMRCMVCTASYHVVDALLPFLHAGDVSLQSHSAILLLAAVEAQQLGQALTILGVLDDTDLRREGQ